MEVVMADDKSKCGPQDRARVDGGEDYEVGYLMKKHHSNGLMPSGW
ncbi:DUF3606 domain-containing protein [Mesorhizobium sp.]